MKAEILFQILFLFTAAANALADAPSAAGGPFVVTSYSVDAGGGHSAGEGYKVRGSSGQPDAGPRIGGAEFELQGGFWAVEKVATDRLFRDRFDDGGTSAILRQSRTLRSGTSTQ